MSAKTVFFNELAKTASPAWTRFYADKLRSGEFIGGNLMNKLRHITKSYDTPKLLPLTGKKGGFQLADTMAMKHHGLVERKVALQSDVKPDAFANIEGPLPSVLSEQGRAKYIENYKKIMNNDTRTSRQQERVKMWERFKKEIPEADMAHIIKQDKDGLVSYYPHIQGVRGGADMSSTTRESLLKMKSDTYPELFDVDKKNMIKQRHHEGATVIDGEPRRLGDGILDVLPQGNADIKYSRRAAFMKKKAG